MNVTVVADSINQDGNRLTTLLATYWRGIHAEVMTHREFSRNASSSRAIPVAKMIADIRDNPFVPMHWGKNQPGMQAREEIDSALRPEAIQEWLAIRDRVLQGVDRFTQLGVHKQIANRPTEWCGYITLLVSATEWPNFFGQRCSKEAEPHMERLAEGMLKAMNDSEPQYLECNEWHRPFIMPSDIEWANSAVAAAKADGFDRNVHPEFTEPWLLLNKISVARCARTSYRNHDLTNPNPAKDIELYEKLAKGHHMSPFEHVARPDGVYAMQSNFRGWSQWRKFIAGEKIQTFDRLIVKTPEMARRRRYEKMVPCGVYGCTQPRLESATFCPSCLDDYRQDPEAYK